MCLQYSPDKHHTSEQEDRTDPPVELGRHPAQIAAQGVGMAFFAEAELQQPVDAFLLMQPVAGVYAFATIDAAIFEFDAGRVDAGNA